MPTYTATAPDGRKVSATGPTPPTDAEWDEIFAAVKTAPAGPFDIDASRAQLEKANAEPLPRQPQLSDEFTARKVGERAWAGAKGELKGFGGGMLALAASPLAIASAARHPVQTLDAAERGAKTVAALAVKAVDDPQAVLSGLQQLGVAIGSDPEKIGMTAGALDAMLATPAVLRAARSTRVGQAIGAGLSSAANKIPGVEDAREAWAASRAPAATTTQPVPASAPPAPPPGPSASTVTPPAVPQPPPPTTPANTPPVAAPPTAPPAAVAAAPAVTPKVQAAAAAMADWTPAEYNAVKDLPVQQRIAYLRMRQGGYAADDAMKTVAQMQKAEQAQTLRAMKGSKKAAAELFNVSEKKVTPEMLARVKEMAPGPSRTPLEGVNYAMDERFKEIALNDPRFQSLLRSGGLGDLASRGAP